MALPASVTPRMAFDALVHVSTLWGVLMAFFFVYVSKQERAAFTAQFTGLVRRKAGASLHTLLANTSAQQVLRSAAYNKLEAAVGQPDAAVMRHNRWVFALGCGVLLVLLAACARYASTHPGLPVGAVLQRNALTFAFIGVLEYALFTNIVSKYDPTPPSAIIKTAVTTFGGLL